MTEQARCILSVDAGGTFLKAALVLANGTVAPGTAFKVPVDSSGPLDVIEQAYVGVAARGAQMARERGLVLDGIGVSICGPFDFTNGVSGMKHKYQSIYGIPLRPWFVRGAGDLPVRFVHDSTAFMLGETWTGPHAGFRRVCGVMLGTGLGFGAILDGKPFLNERQGPGIIIYNRPYRDGIAEEYVARRGILARYRQLVPGAPDGFDVLDIGNLADAGDPAAIKVFQDTGIFLAEILHDVIRDYAFECLVMGGQISRSTSVFKPQLQAGLADIPALKLIEQADRINDAPLLGVARACWYPDT